MRTENLHVDTSSTFNGPAPLYESMVRLMQQNMDLSRDLMRRSLDSMQKLAGLPNETIGRLEPFRGPASAWSDLNHRSIEMMQRMADQRMDTLQQWTRIGFELFERSMPPVAQEPEVPEPPMPTRMAEKPRRAA